MIRVKWIGLAAIVAIAASIIGYKAHVNSQNAAEIKANLPRVLLVANMSEADTPGDNCAQIIHLVREAQGRGIHVQILEPGSKSDLLARYHVLTIPTVLILDHEGAVVSRFEGEASDTVQAIRTGLEKLRADGK